LASCAGSGYGASGGGLVDHLSEQAGPTCTLTGGELIPPTHGLFAPANVITMTLYAAAAQHDGCDFDPDDFVTLTHWNTRARADPCAGSMTSGLR
jgi:hypothetical protein